jgi:alginate O-acetyltransferase complex protein AlgI
LFVRDLFFPHLIAGPILHHAEMMPQFARDSTYRVQAENIAVG